MNIMSFVYTKGLISHVLPYYIMDHPSLVIFSNTHIPKRPFKIILHSSVKLYHIDRTRSLIDEIMFLRRLTDSSRDSGANNGYIETR